MRESTVLPLLCALALGASAQTPSRISATGGNVPPAAENAPAVSGVAVAQPLRDAVLAQLDFTGTAAQRSMFASIVTRCLEAPTCRELAADFNATGARVGAAFEAFPGTEVYESEPGVESFAANQAAHAIRTETSASIALNDACLTVPGRHAADLCAEQFSHEVFGHVLGWAEASPAVRKVYWLYDDELLARMVAWNVELELTGKVRDPEAWCAADDPGAAQAHLPAVYPSSSWSLTRAELRDPAASLRAHEKYQRDDKDRAELDQELAWFSGPWGAANAAAARAAAADPLFDRLEARLETLRRRLLASDAVLSAPPLCGNYR